MAAPAIERRSRARREDDRLHTGGWQRFLRENWYRDVWLLIITFVVLLTCVAIAKQFSDLKQLRARAVASSCRADQAQDNVLRAILVTSLNLRGGRPQPDGLTDEEARNTAARLMEPLGGLQPTQRDLDARCAAAVREFVTDPPQ